MTRTHPSSARLYAVSAALVLACNLAQRSPEEDLRQILRALVVAIEEKDPEAVLQSVAYAYQGEDGLGYPEVQAIVLSFLLREEPIGARLKELTVEPAGADSRRRVQARVLFARGVRLQHDARAAPPGSVEYFFDLIFARDDKGWKAISGRYQRL